MFNRGLYTISLSIVLLGGLNWLTIGVNNFNIIKFLISKLIKNDNVDKISNIMYLIIGICTVYLLIFQQRHMFLSFLDETVMPPIVFSSQAPVFNNAKLTVNAHNGLKVIYWASNPVRKDYDNISNWRDAYDGYANSGVANVINDKAELVFSIPVRYKVGLFNNLLDRHIHYRILYPNGIVSKIYTKKIDNNLANKIIG